MSCYEWEEGTIKLPSGQFSKFRRELNEFYNRRQEQIQKNAESIFGKLTAAGKGKRNFDYAAAIRPLLEVRTRDPWIGYVSNEIDGAEEIKRAVLNIDTGKIKRPLKKQFSRVKLTNNKLELDEAVIVFNPQNYTVSWRVYENNHACERAHQDPIACEFFKMLDRVKWVRGTGGVIQGNDEYNSSSDGPGTHYTKFSYGPKCSR